MVNNSLHRKRGAPLEAPELIAIALGGMIGGGIFSILGISVALIGPWTPVAIAIGAALAFLAAYSYVKLGVYFQDEGATYSFMKRTFPKSPFAASVIGWFVVFGYISTLALYSYTFASYAISGFTSVEADWMRKIVAGSVILLFALINVWSVRGMGKAEDIMVYTKLIILAVVSFVLLNNSQVSLPHLFREQQSFPLLEIFVVSSLTFVAYEGFQLVINAVQEMENIARNIPRSIYIAIGLTAVIYIVIALGALSAIPIHDIIRDKEYALASGAEGVLGLWGRELMVVGAMLATSSAISGTMFGASRQMAVIATDGYFPQLLSIRKERIPIYAIITMAFFAWCLVLVGGLEVILEFGSLTFLLVSLLVSFANVRMRKETKASLLLLLLAIGGLSAATLLILGYELVNRPERLAFTFGLYALLTFGAWMYARISHGKTH